MYFCRSHACRYQGNRFQSALTSRFKIPLVCMYVSMYVRMYVMYQCMHVCMYVCMTGGVTILERKAFRGLLAACYEKGRGTRRWTSIRDGGWKEGSSSPHAALAKARASSGGVCMRLPCLRGHAAPSGVPGAVTCRALPRGGGGGFLPAALHPSPPTSGGLWRGAPRPQGALAGQSCTQSCVPRVVWNANTDALRVSTVTPAAAVSHPPGVLGSMLGVGGFCAARRPKISSSAAWFLSSGPHPVPPAA